MNITLTGKDMDCKDLMVGDWVICNDLKRQVVAIGETVGFLDCNNQVYWAYEGFDRIDPIPLTEEILVKNGFKKESQTIDGDYCKYILPGFTLNWCDTDGFWYQNGDIAPNHVHTLQHLLRLCGVEKEIEL